MEKETKSKILEAAVELFSERGFRNTTVRDICSEARVNVASVNYHFNGKRGLGKKVVEHLVENVSEVKEVLNAVESISNESEWKKTITSFIFNFISDRDKEGYRNYYRSRLIFLELNNPSELFAQIYEKYIGPLLLVLNKVIRMGLPEEATDEEISMWVITLMSQCVMFRKKQIPLFDMPDLDFSKSDNVRRTADHIASTIFSGLKYRGH